MLESLSLEAWHAWFIAASLIAMIELLLIASYYLLALAGGAAIVAVVTAAFTVPTSMQWFVFAIATGLMSLLLYTFRSPANKAIPDDISYMVGKRVEVLERVAPRGRVMYKAVSWAAESEDELEVGAHACIQSVHGSTLMIKKLAKDEV